MEKNRKKKVALLVLPITFFLVFISVSFALDIHATVKVLPKWMEIRLIQPTNTTYYTNYDSKNILLIIVMDDEAWRSLRSDFWMGYSLDDLPIVNITTNTWLGKLELKYYMKFMSNIPLGSHKLVVYVNDTKGNSASTKVFFTIEKMLPSTTTSTTSTTIPTTTTTIPIVCSGKNFLLCAFSSGCKWSGDLRIGRCVEK